MQTAIGFSPSGTECKGCGKHRRITLNSELHFNAAKINSAGSAKVSFAMFANLVFSRPSKCKILLKVDTGLDMAR